MPSACAPMGPVCQVACSLRPLTHMSVLFAVLLVCTQIVRQLREVLASESCMQGLASLLTQIPYAGRRAAGCSTCALNRIDD